jgi:hypothetical protein
VGGDEGVGFRAVPEQRGFARAIFGARFEPQSTLKALSFFGDGNLATLDPEVKARLVADVRGVDLDQLPDPGLAASGIGA